MACCPARRSATARFSPAKFEGAGNWSPGNSDGTYGGIQPVSYGLIHSRNTMSVRVGEFAGLDDVQKAATTLGLADNIPHGPAIYIGSFETNLKDLTAAYTVFPNAGVRKQSYIIERIDDQDHNPIYRAAHVTVPALDPGAAWMTSELMEEVLTTRNRRERAVVRLQASGRRKDRHDERLQGRLVCRLHQRDDLRRLGRIRSADHDHSARLRCRAGLAGLDAGDDQGLAAISGSSLAVHSSDDSRHGLQHLESSRYHGMQLCRHGLRNHSAGRSSSG